MLQKIILTLLFSVSLANSKAHALENDNSSTRVPPENLFQKYMPKRNGEFKENQNFSEFLENNPQLVELIIEKVINEIVSKRLKELEDKQNSYYLKRNILLLIILIFIAKEIQALKNRMDPIENRLSMRTQTIEFFNGVGKVVSETAANARDTATKIAHDSWKYMTGS